MAIPTEPIGSIPRPPDLLEAIADFENGHISDAALAAHYEDAVKSTICSLEQTQSPIVSDGEQSKPSFATYPIAGNPNLAGDGVTIPFTDGHSRQLPRLTGGPFRYHTYAASYLNTALRYATVPVKQSVIAASALSLLYPQDELSSYGRKQFLADLVSEARKDIRDALDLGAYKVQIDFTEGRLSLKLDPSKGVLHAFLDLLREVLAGFSEADLGRIGVHTCPGADMDSTHSLDVDYAELLPDLLQLPVGSFYLQMASEPDPRRVLSLIRDHLPPAATIFVGVIDPIDPQIETAEEVCERLLEAADYIPVERLGSCDDCGFAPFSDDVSTSRSTAFEKVRARVQGTARAAAKLGR